MDLANRDNIIEDLNEKINQAQDNVIDYLEDSKKVQNENEFLESVTKDYEKYHKHILNEKKRERNQLQMLTGYLDKILKEAGLSAEIANKARFQQNNILEEMDKIKSELDRITGEQERTTTSSTKNLKYI